MLIIRLCFIAIFILNHAVSADIEDVLENLKATTLERPSLLLTEATLQNARQFFNNDNGPNVYQHFIGMTDQMLELPVLEREMDGRRMLTTSRKALRRILHWGLAYALTKEDRYADACKKLMLKAATFKNWNPHHFLDVAELCTAMGLGYDWIHHKLSEEEREIIRNAIINKGLKQDKVNPWWVKADNNWNQVCHTGLSIGALAIRDTHPEYAQRIVARALKHVPIVQDIYGPDGAYPEGAGYWQYGTTYNILLIEALRTNLGTAGTLDKHKAFLQSAFFFRHALGPSGNIYNYADCGTSKATQINPALFWMANELQAPTLLLRERALIKKFIELELDVSNRSHRFYPLLFLWNYPIEKQSESIPLSWQGGGHVPVSMHRTSWEKGAVYLGIKGGSPSANHAHMDIGSFVFDAHGYRWAEDIGKESYGKIEAQGINLWDRKQNSDRWKLFRNGSFGHNILTVNQEQQLVKGHGKIIKSQLEGEKRFCQFELSSLYKTLSSAQRGGALLADGRAIIQDQITVAEEDATIRWAMVTKAEIELSDDKRSATLKRADKHIRISLDTPSDATFSVISAKPPTDYEKQNKDMRILVFFTTVKANAKQTLRVSFLPNKDDQPPALTPLSDW